MDSNTKDLSKEKQAHPSANETVSELAHRHLQDEKHVTTDEEIRNIHLDLDSVEGIMPYNGQIKTDKDDDEEDDIITTPLSVLGE